MTRPFPSFLLLLYHFVLFCYTSFFLFWIWFSLFLSSAGAGTVDVDMALIDACRVVVMLADEPCSHLNSYSAAAVAAAAEAAAEDEEEEEGGGASANDKGRDETFTDLIDLVIQTTHNVIKMLEQVCNLLLGPFSHLPSSFSVSSRLSFYCCCCCRSWFPNFSVRVFHAISSIVSSCHSLFSALFLPVWPPPCGPPRGNAGPRRASLGHAGPRRSTPGFTGTPRASAGRFGHCRPSSIIR